jgi:phage terminase small subunit
METRKRRKIVTGVRGKGRQGLSDKPRKPRESKLSDKQERFAMEYVKDFDRERAYKDAGYSSDKMTTIAVECCRLLKNPRVQVVIIREKARMAERIGLDAEGVVRNFMAVYMEAYKCRDWGSAISALKELAKHYGIYEVHNKQKKYSPADIEKLKEELTKVGFDFNRINFPPPSEIAKKTSSN